MTGQKFIRVERAAKSLNVSLFQFTKMLLQKAKAGHVDLGSLWLCYYPNKAQIEQNHKEFAEMPEWQRIASPGRKWSQRSQLEILDFAQLRNFLRIRHVRSLQIWGPHFDSLFRDKPSLIDLAKASAAKEAIPTAAPAQIQPKNKRRRNRGSKFHIFEDDYLDFIGEHDGKKWFEGLYRPDGSVIKEQFAQAYCSRKSGGLDTQDQSPKTIKQYLRSLERVRGSKSIR